MDVNTLKAVYFIGAGGIGMSALVRYFLSIGKKVGGYDRTPSELTEKLIAEGASIHYEESVEDIPADFLDVATTLIVYTPAIPATHAELTYFQNNGFTIQKRSQVLGMLTQSGKGLCVAGTHGKTTTSTMTAHLLHQSSVGCNAFLGGISKNYGTNLLLSEESEYIVTSVSFKNESDLVATLEMLSSFTLGELTPFIEDDAPEALELWRMLLASPLQILPSSSVWLTTIPKVFSRLCQNKLVCLKAL